MNSKQITQAIFFGLLVIFMAACGGGGGNTPDPTPTPINNIPTAIAQSLTTLVDTSVEVTLTGSDADGDTLSFTLVDSPANGSISGTAPNLIYTPESDFAGSDSFTFKVNDGTDDSATATINIVVSLEPNEVPVALNQSVEALPNNSIAIILTGTDADDDPLSFIIASNPANGTLEGNPPNLLYTPNTNFIGTDSFTFIVNDGKIDSVTATVNINVVTQNIAPIANSQVVTTHVGTNLDITLTGNDENGDSLAYMITNNPANGSLTGIAPDLTYVPDAGFVGNDSFSFLVNDGTADSNEANIDISVTNTAPAAISQSVDVSINTDQVITLTGSDSDTEDTLVFNLVTQPTNGTLSGTAPNLTYSPDTDYFGNDAFTFVVNDGTEDSPAATINISVNNSVPQSFSFTDLPEVAPGSEHESNNILVTGINIVSEILITGGEYSIDGADFTNSEGTVENNQSVVVKVTASNVALETVDVILSIGGVQDTFSVTTSNDNTEPTATIDFPSQNSLTTASSIIVRGSTQDNGTIASVTINDTEATSNDNFVTWTAIVPLLPGLNSLTVEATDLGGNISSNGSTVSIESRQLFTNKQTAHFNNTTDQFVFYDGTLRALYSFDATTQNYALISDSSTPDNQNSFQSLKDFEIDEAANTAYSIDGATLDRILQTDLDNGTRTAVTADTESVAVHTLDRPHQIIVDAELNVAYVFDATPVGQGREAIIKFDLNTGAASLVTDNTFPSSGFSSFVWPDTIALDKANNRILMADTFGSDRILTIDLDNGERDTLWDNSNTMSLSAPKGIAVDTKNSRALVYQSGQIIGIALDTGIATVVASDLSLPVSTFSIVDTVYDGSDDNNRLFVVTNSSVVYQIDFATGLQTIFSDNTTPNADNPISRATGISIDQVNSRLLVTDSNSSSVIAVDLTTAERIIVSDSVTPNADNALISPSDIDVLSGTVAFAVDAGSLALLRINMSNGARTILSDNNTVDDNNTFNTLRAMALDSANSRTLVVDSGRRSLLSVDNTTGDRSIISDIPNSGEENPISNPGGLILQGGRGLISERSTNSILSVDLTTGARTVFSGPGVPDDVNPFTDPEKMILDTINNRLLVLDNNSIMAVSVSDGSRTTLSSNTVPDSNHPFFDLSDITFDAANQQALVMDRDMQIALAVDLNTGERTPYMGTTPSGSPSLYIPFEIVFDDLNNQLTVGTGGSIGLTTVDPETGARTLFSTGSMPLAQDLEIDPASQRMFMVSTNALYEVDRTTAAITLISGSGLPDNENNFSSVSGMALDMENNLAYVTDRSNDYLLAVNLDTGVRTIVSSNTFPDDINPFNNSVSLVFDKENSRLLVVDSNNDEILAVDIATGTRTIFSNNGIPDTTNNFSNPVDILLDSDNSRLLVLDSSRDAIIAVDITTGARTLLTNIDSSIANLMRDAAKMTMTSKPNQVMVTDTDNGVVLVDLVTGEQVIISK